MQRNITKEGDGNGDDVREANNGEGEKVKQTVKENIVLNTAAIKN